MVHAVSACRSCQSQPIPNQLYPTRLVGARQTWIASTLNVCRHGTLTLVDGLVQSMYALANFTELVWNGPLSRPQTELIAARVSAINECFY